jgi:hypothetical protein
MEKSYNFNRKNVDYVSLQHSFVFFVNKQYFHNQSHLINDEWTLTNV